MSELLVWLNSDCLQAPRLTGVQRRQAVIGVGAQGMDQTRLHKERTCLVPGLLHDEQTMSLPLAPSRWSPSTNNAIAWALTRSIQEYAPYLPTEYIEAQPRHRDASPATAQAIGCLSSPHASHNGENDWFHGLGYRLPGGTRLRRCRLLLMSGEAY